MRYARSGFMTVSSVKRADFRTNFLGAVATPVYSFTLRYSSVKITPGKHRFLVALARNSNVLYTGIRPASIVISVT
jgi:hypothetical protein